jgi:flagellar basal-body rod protein FlgF
MSSGIWAAASGAVGQLADLEVTAENLANANTNGYRAERSIFRQVLADAAEAGVAAEYRRYATLRTRTPTLEEGPTLSTGRPLDVKLPGEHVLAVRTAEGDRYTRDGALQISPEGRLVTRDGDALLDRARRPISLPRDAQRVAIDREGRVVVDGREHASLVVLRPGAPDDLEKQGQNLLRLRAGAPPPAAVTVELVPEALEGSNVSVMRGMTDLIASSRTLEAMQKVIDAFRESEQRAASGIMGRT